MDLTLAIEYLEGGVIEARRRRALAITEGRPKDWDYWDGYRQALSDIIHNELIDSTR